MLYVSNATAEVPQGGLAPRSSLVQHKFAIDTEGDGKTIPPANSTTPSTIASITSDSVNGSVHNGDDLVLTSADNESSDDDGDTARPRMSTTYMEEDDVAVKPLSRSVSPAGSSSFA
jgi:hypothetical protein